MSCRDGCTNTILLATRMTRRRYRIALDACGLQERRQEASAGFGPTATSPGASGRDRGRPHPSSRRNLGRTGERAGLYRHAQERQLRQETDPRGGLTKLRSELAGSKAGFAATNDTVCASITQWPRKTGSLN